MIELTLLSAILAGGEPLHFTYLWHMEQPIYWPDRRGEGPHRYERAWSSILQNGGGATNPENDLATIFSTPASRLPLPQWKNRYKQSCLKTQG